MHLTETTEGVGLAEKIAFKAESDRETVRGILSPLGVSLPSIHGADSSLRLPAAALEMNAVPPPSLVSRSRLKKLLISDRSSSDLRREEDRKNRPVNITLELRKVFQSFTSTIHVTWLQHCRTCPVGASHSASVISGRAI